MDGKQARRINMSSPLGMLFDHGLDAINTILSSLTVARIMPFNPVEQTLFAILSTLIFYLATLEQYYSHEMNLPIINGPNEGLYGAIAGFLITSVLGPEFWLNTHIFGYSLKFYLVNAILVAGFGTLLYKY